MTALAPHTHSIFDAVTKLDCIRPYTLVGGTALSLQLANRLSEDLDFMSWRTSKTEKREVDWPAIEKELMTVGSVELRDILDINHVNFIVNDVKISFYANPNYSPFKAGIPYKNNLVIADKTAIGAMKMEVMLRRSKFRDYYDLYSLLKDGQDLSEMIQLALKYSGHKLKTKNLIAMLTRSERFIPDAEFSALAPAYQVTPKEIEHLIIQIISNVMK